MNNNFSKHINELTLMQPIKKIASSLEWSVISGSGSIVSDDDLVELVFEITKLLKKSQLPEARAQALLGMLYTAERIINTCILIKSNGTDKPLETDLAISLNLPGEPSSGLAFMKVNNHVQLLGANTSVATLLSTMNDILAESATSSSSRRDHGLTLPLHALSTIYSRLTELALTDF